MEYLPLGKLETQDADFPIAVEEMLVLLHQCPTAVDYLHAAM
jgi:hypothetical protein